MAIKRNWLDISRRIYNWVDVQKVIYNGSQIRPTEIPHINYHIMSDFTGWWGWWGGGWQLPTWWTWQWIVIGEGGIYAWITGSWTVTYDEERGMPSLAYAKKLQLVLNYDWIVPVSPSAGDFLQMSLRNGNTQYAWWSLRYMSWNYMQITLAKMGYFTNVSTDNYTTSILWNMEDSESPFWEMDTEWPSSFSAQSIHQWMNTASISNIRSCNKLVITIGNWITLKSIDFYIWN